MTRFHSNLCFCLAALVLWPLSASANAGTPLMWATMFHAVFGNALIGLGEGLVLARVFKVSTTEAVLSMVLANYLSAWAGGSALTALAHNGAPELFGSQPLHSAGRVLCLLGLGSYLASVLLELPFCYFALRKTERPWRCAILGSLLVQTLSYAVLVPYYLCVSPISLLTQTTHDPTLAFAGNEKAWIYYISADNGDIHRIRPNGTGREFVQAAAITNQMHRLYLQPSRDEASWDLALVTERGNRQEGSPSKVLREQVGKRLRKPPIPDSIEGTWFNFHERFDYRMEAEKKWTIQLGFWSAGGVRADSRVTGETRRFALEAPFLMQWQARNATILPSGLLIYQLGPQIVALDVEGKRVGVITLGRGPAVVWGE